MDTKKLESERKAQEEHERQVREAHQVLKKHLKTLSKNQLVAAVIELAGRLTQIQETQEQLRTAIVDPNPQTEETKNEGTDSSPSPAV